MAARLGCRQKAVNQKMLATIVTFWSGFCPHEDAVGTCEHSERLAGEICVAVVRIRRSTSVLRESSPTCQSAKKHLQSTKFIIPCRARALGLAGRAFLCALRSAICAATTAIPSTPFTRGVREVWA